MECGCLHLLFQRLCTLHFQVTFTQLVYALENLLCSLCMCVHVCVRPCSSSHLSVCGILHPHTRMLIRFDNPTPSLPHLHGTKGVVALIGQKFPATSLPSLCRSPRMLYLSVTNATSLPLPPTSCASPVPPLLPPLTALLPPLPLLPLLVPLLVARYPRRSLTLQVLGSAVPRPQKPPSGQGSPWLGVGQYMPSGQSNPATKEPSCKHRDLHDVDTASVVVPNVKNTL